MKAVVKNGVAILSPQGFLDGNTAALMTVEDVEHTINLNANMVLVSLKKVIFFNKNGLDIFVNVFKKVREKKHNCIVGFCDYDYKKFKSIKNFFKRDLNFSLFMSQDIAYLFSSSFSQKNLNVLIYNEDKSQRSAMAIDLHDAGHNPIIAQTEAEFKEKKAAEGSYDVAIENSYLGQISQSVAAKVSGNAIIYTLSNFLDAELTDLFNMKYHNNSLNVGFRLFVFDAHKVVSMNVHAMNFFAKLASSSAEYNATICLVGLKFDKTPLEFKENLEDAGIMFFQLMEQIFDDKELLEELSGSSADSGLNRRHITKSIVAELPQFINAAVETIEMMTNSKAAKEAANIDEIKIVNQENQIASSLGFFGEIDGMVILVFPKDIAKKACQLLIGEETDDIALILDTLGELVNIVGGKIKTLLSNNGLNVDITLPRTYPNIDALLEVTQDRKGVQVDLSFDNDKFLFFLTR